MSDSADRAFAANILGTLAQTIVDRQSIAMDAVAGRGGNAPAALVTLRFYPERPIAFLAHRLRISHPGAVQLVDRLAADGLVERVPAPDGRTRHLVLTAPHPSPLSAHRGFLGCRHFSQANAYLERHGIAPIDWNLNEPR